MYILIDKIPIQNKSYLVYPLHYFDFVSIHFDFVINVYPIKEKRSTEGCSKFKSPETRQVQERLVSTLEHMQVPKWDRTRCPEE